jgi:serine phosphatase RsbU (regulator of sigma subunit)
VAWRALVLAGHSPAEILAVVQRVLEHERQDDGLFATLAMVSVAPDRGSGWVRLAGHLPPLLVTGTEVRELEAPSYPPPGLVGTGDWPGLQVQLGGSWSILLYTDGLVEGRIGNGSRRLGSEGLMDLIREALKSATADAPPGSGGAGEGGPADGRLLDQVIEQVRELNGGALDDDLAIVAVSYVSPEGP